MSDPFAQYADFSESSDDEDHQEEELIIDTGPPPNTEKRRLIFDSMAKIIGKNFQMHERGESGSKGTYIFTFGAGFHGQLGRRFVRGNRKYSNVPMRVTELDMPIRQIACGGLHTAAVTDSGTLYTWGDSREFQLGYTPRGFTHQTIPAPVSHMAGFFVMMVACGQEHTAVVTDKGQLFTWGRGNSGQCGHGDKSPRVKKPKLITSPRNVRYVDVSCGDRHTASLSTEGKLYTFGSGEHGQLGHGDDVFQLRPLLVDSLQDKVLTSVVCGAIQTTVLTDTGALYCFGFGESMFGEEGSNFMYSPKLIHFQNKVKQVACGQSHIMVLDEFGDVYCWGNGSYGQIGHGIKGSLQAPRIVLGDKDVAQIASGRYHSMALTSAGVLYSWGCGENGQLGHGDDGDKFFPKVLEHSLGTVVGMIACGEHHTTILTSTPWVRLHQETEEFLKLEQKEYELKGMFAKQTNHGLFKKDQDAIRLRMQQVKLAWEADKAEQKKKGGEEEKRNVTSVQTRQKIQEEMKMEFENKESRMQPMVEKQLLNMLGAKQQEGKKQRRRAKYPSGSQSARGVAGGEGDDGRATSAGSVTSRAGPLLAVTQKQARAGFLKESTQMIERMRQVIHNTQDTSSQVMLNKMMVLVFDFRKEYDTLRARTVSRADKLRDAELEAISLQKGSESNKEHKSRLDSTCKDLEMKLKTVTLRIAEAEENRKTYELNIAHLKQEELERFQHLEALRKQGAENDAFYKKMNELKLHAVEDRTRAESELVAFRQEIGEFQNFIEDQLMKFHDVSDEVKMRREQREAEKQRRLIKRQNKVDQRVEELNEELKVKNLESTAMAQQLDSVNERLRYFEKRFQQISSATGLTNPDAIINKFTLKEEIKQELDKEIQSKMELLEQLKHQDKDLKETEERAKKEYHPKTWKDVNEADEAVESAEFRETNKETEKSSEEKKIFVFLEGLHSLNSSLPSEFAHSGDITREWQDDLYANLNQSGEKAVELLSVIEDKISGLQHAVHGQAVHLKALEARSQLANATFAGGLANVVLRGLAPTTARQPNTLGGNQTASSPAGEYSAQNHFEASRFASTTEPGQRPPEMVFKTESM